MKKSFSLVGLSQDVKFSLEVLGPRGIAHLKCPKPAGIAQKLKAESLKKTASFARVFAGKHDLNVNGEWDFDQRSHATSKQGTSMSRSPSYAYAEKLTPPDVRTRFGRASLMPLCPAEAPTNGLGRVYTHGISLNWGGFR